MRIPSEKMPMMIGGDENGGSFASSSRLTLGQAMDGEFPPLDVTPNASESDILVHKDDPNGKSESENQEPHSGDDHPESSSNPRKRNRYHRHSQYQIQELETFFKGCPHPDDKQRKELGLELGLEPLQVKFWFQNKRTQMKSHHERQENAHLRNENERLRAENIRYRETLSSAACHNCSGPAAIAEMSVDEHQLWLENARLKQEMERVSAIAARFAANPFSSLSVLSSPLAQGSIEQEFGALAGQSAMTGNVIGAEDLLIRSLSGPTYFNKQLIIELAVSSIEELSDMAQTADPLWIPNIDRTTYVLNEDEYMRMFPRKIRPKLSGFKTEASREHAVVFMNHLHIIDIFMDLSKWVSVFSSIVSRAMMVDVLSIGAGPDYDGAMHVISAEFQGLSPAVPTRDCSFVRYCKRVSKGSWAVVDVSLDSLIHGAPVAKCHRRPSGCLIQEMPKGYSKITWVEHVEMDDREAHYLSRTLINSGQAYGAKRWLAILDRQCERLASACVTNLPIEDLNEMVLTNPEGRKNLLKLSERMVLSFCGGVTSSSAHSWNIVYGNGVDEARIMTRKSVNDRGRPSGVVLSAVISFWLPVAPQTVFEFLRDESTRNEWDILSNGGGHVQEMAHIANGQETGNCVSLLRVSNGNAAHCNMLILQESSTDSTASFVIYAPVDTVSMNMLLGGGNPDNVALLPSGFTILPSTPNDYTAGISDAGPNGTLLTIAFQILVDSSPTAKVSLGSIATVNNLIESTTHRLKAAFLG